MLRDMVAIGDKVELILMDRNEDTEKKTLKSKVLDFPNYTSVIIAMPIIKGRIIPLSVGDKYSLRFFSQTGLYECKGLITDRSNDDKIYILTVEITSALEKYQRRQFFRLSCVLDLDYYIASEAELSLRYKLKQNAFKTPEDKQACLDALEQCNREWLMGIVVDLSGGGIRLMSESVHEIGNTIQMRIQFTSKVNLKTDYISGVIISADKMTNRNGFYEYRAQFKEVLKEDREAIIKYIFEEEIKQRTKAKK
ncbi:flagellar brake protein [Anaerocolumna chitinilytica]|uniref:Flagellar protein n=1 Tax=Anaerocolumna chitinilytica TaxID=1727145 RepID=A0A7I8DST3_9FIRM|nr:flagellar brake protein [Anaerocolumna chitinilytica]BCK00146.1 flagellar protein [Anaerocolumna chitinilytica]